MGMRPSYVHGASATPLLGQTIGENLDRAVERWADREAVWLMVGDRTRIGLWTPQVGLAGGRGGTHVHYAMHVPRERYDAAVATLRERGQEVEEHRFPAYDESRAAYVTDPDGNVVELWTYDVANHLA